MPGKTVYVDGNPSLGTQGTVVYAAFLNAVNNHRHLGTNTDGDGAIDYAADTGSANAYVIALTPALMAYIVGMPIRVKAVNANTGASTLNVNGLGAIAIKKNSSLDLAAGDIQAGQMIEVVYDGTYFQMAGQLGNTYIAHKNAIINGACKVAQRPVALLSTSRNYGMVDRFGAWAAGTAVSAGTITQDVASPTGLEGYALFLSGITITGSGVVNVDHRIESYNSMRFNNNLATFSVLVHHDVGAAINFQITVNKANSADNFTAVTQIQQGIATTVQSATGTLLTLNKIAMGNCSNGIQIIISASCGAVTTKNFRFTEWQLEDGPIATQFERRDIGVEVLQCQRYYEKLGGINNSIHMGGYNTAGAQMRMPISFKATKRANGTLVLAGAWTCTNCSQPYIIGSSTNECSIAAAVTSTGTAYCSTADATTYITVDCDL